MSRGRRYETEGKLNYQKVFCCNYCNHCNSNGSMIIKMYLYKDKTK